MTTQIYYFTGTGNSLWAARKLAENLDNARLISLAADYQVTDNAAAQIIGLVFPVHIWGLPRIVIDFTKRLNSNSAKYYFALAVNAGQVAATLLQLQNILSDKGLALNAGFSLDMPSNYIPWGGAIAENKQQNKFRRSEEKIKHIAEIIKEQRNLAPEKGPLWQNIIFSFFYRKSFPHIHKMDKSFWADDKCTDCRICEKICPAHNILLTEGKPSWQHNCEQCFACLQWCPEEAIQYGKNTQKKKRYRHPEIKLKDMLASVSAK
ncbi:MAG TPA: EFR1 family ferrodoxin [Smithellaceae bacterium]|nr:EFR1 family ferrodoxin [Smithellaceae bacterium]HRS88984.1 EFR1 family ferrodoxin [Smithellaceae bacterium]HRV25600.1 EFR1 family ferrodoxin [Smithellaceae bacterium]